MEKRPVRIAGGKTECGPRQVECPLRWHELAGPLKVPAIRAVEIEKSSEGWGLPHRSSPPTNDHCQRIDYAWPFQSVKSGSAGVLALAERRCPVGHLVHGCGDNRIGPTVDLRLRHSIHHGPELSLNQDVRRGSAGKWHGRGLPVARP